MQAAYYLLKSRASSLTFQKNWEVGLKDRMIPASSSRKTSPCSKGIGTCPP